MLFENEPFLLVHPPDSLPGAGYILSTKPPYYIGKVVKMKPEEVQMFEINQKKEYHFCGIYSVAIIAEGSLAKQYVPFDRTIMNMAEFYLQQRILSNAGRYKRYKL